MWWRTFIFQRQREVVEAVTKRGTSVLERAITGDGDWEGEVASIFSRFGLSLANLILQVQVLLADPEPLF